MSKIYSMEQYQKVDAVLKSYEQNRPYHTRDIHWACERIFWLNKWKKLPPKMINELADRATAILKGEI